MAGLRSRGYCRDIYCVCGKLRVVPRRYSRWLPPQYTDRPPLMSNSCPVENEHSSDDSHATIAAISSGLTKRPFGTCSTIHFTFSGVNCLRMSVSATDGHTAFTRISV